MHILLVQSGGEHLDVATAAVDVLLVFDGELNDGLFALVAELVEGSGQSVEFGVLACLDALVGFGVAVELAVAQNELAEIVFVFRVDPSAFPTCKKTRGEVYEKFRFSCILPSSNLSSRWTFGEAVANATSDKMRNTFILCLMEI